MADCFITRHNSNNKNNFSTEEQVAGTWIDGRTIYKKTVIFETTSQSTKQTTLTNYYHNIENVDLIWFSGDSFWVNNSTGTSKILGFQTGITNDIVASWNYTFNSGVESGRIWVITAPEIKNTTIYATVMYVKKE